MKKAPTTETFLIPKLDVNNGGSFDFYRLVNKYVEMVNKELCPGPDETLWWCGRVLTEGGTKFVKQNFGIKQMRAIPRFLAEKFSSSIAGFFVQG